MKQACFHKNTNEHEDFNMRVPSNNLKTDYFRMNMIITKPNRIIDPLSQLRLIAMLIATFLCLQSNAQVNIDSGLVAYYPFNGDANDLITNIEGIVTNATLNIDRFNKSNSCYSFNGTTSVINLGVNPGINSIVNDYTISYWIMRRDNSNDCVILSYSGTNCWRFINAIYGSKSYSSFTPSKCGTTRETWLSTNNVGTNFTSWYNITVVRCGFDVYTYINGILDSHSIKKIDGIADPNSISAVTKIGCSWTNTSFGYFSGSIDDIRFYNRALNAEEIKLIYTSPQTKPVAKAGSNQTVNENTKVTLDGSGSYDPDGDTLTYLWTAPAGIKLNSNNIPKPEFTAPEVKKDSSLIFKLVVNDGIESSVADQVKINVKQVNKAPVANAGNDQTVGESIPVTLDGIGSYDRDGDKLTYLWIVPAGIMLSDKTAPSPVFVTPDITKDTTFIFKLVVKDGVLSSATDQVSITVKHTNKEPLDRCLVAYFPFNGDAIDQITGTKGNVIKATPIYDHFGRSDSAYSFNGSSVIDLGKNPGINSIVKDYTISYWIKKSTSDYKNRGVILSASGSCLRFFNGVQGVGTTDKYSISYSNYGTGKNGATRVKWTSSSKYPIRNSSWYNITVVRYGNSVYSYINGAEASFDTGDTVSIANGSTPAITKIGCSWSLPKIISFNNFAGAIDDIRFYNRALNEEEVKMICTSPQANAGPDQTVNEDTEVTLNGSGSIDDLGSKKLKYFWTAPKGITLSSNNVMYPKFIAPVVKRDTTFVFSLVVNDSLVSSFPDRISVTVKQINKAPVANAGSDQTVNEKAQVTLNGSASSDPDGDTLTYLWTAPVGISLSSNNVPNPTFSSPEVKKDTTLIFKLVVNDGSVNSSFDEVSILVKQVNQQPTANAGNDQIVDEGYPLTLDGSGSTDPDGDPLTYQWTSPQGIALSSNTVVKPTLTAPEVTNDTTFTFALVVTDGIISSTTSYVQITVKQVNKVPIANAGSTIDVTEGDMVTLDGSASYDPDGDPIAFKWTAPTGIILSSDTISRPTFTAPWIDSDITIVFTLVVSDGNLNSKIDTVIVNVVNGVVPNYLILADTTLSSGTSSCFGAIDTLILAGNETIVLFDTESSTTLIAGKTILFLPGFHALSGSYVDAYITSDGTFCDGQPSSIVEQTIEKGIQIADSESKKGKSDNNHLIVYPNPTSGQLTIETSLNEHNSSVFIYNSLGACIWNSPWVNSNKLTVEIPGKQQGIYIIRIIQNNQQESRKIIVE